MRIFAMSSLSLLSLVSGIAFAHDRHTVGQGEQRYEIVLGYVNEPPYTEQLNGIDLRVHDMAEAPVENLESSLSAAIIAPDGGARRELPLRAVYNEPGAYTSDFILGEPGAYTFEITGFIGELEVNLTAPYDHTVEPAADLRFP